MIMDMPSHSFKVVENPGCSKIVRSSHPQKALRRRSRPTPPKQLWLRRPGATPHKRAFEDGDEMAVFQQPTYIDRG
jgi:hypothetical protein